MGLNAKDFVIKNKSWKKIAYETNKIYLQLY